jgi:hypothetical protein
MKYVLVVIGTIAVQHLLRYVFRKVNTNRVVDEAQLMRQVRYW